jgi:hypothetical protein
MNSEIFINIVPILNQFKSRAEILRYLGLNKNKNNYIKINNFLTENNLECSHLQKPINPLINASDDFFLKIAESCGSVRAICREFNVKISSSNWDHANLRLKKLNIDINDNNRQKETGKWLAQEIQLLKDNYSLNSPDIVAKLFPNRTKDAIILKANSLKLKSPNSGFYNSKIEKLLDDSLETYYWLGFILADGSINVKQGRLKIAISINDVDHLRKFVNYIEAKNTIKNYIYDNSKTSNFSIMNSIVIKQFANKFNICQNKTICAPAINIFEKMNDQNFLSMLIGFIDGDGCIMQKQPNNYCVIAIKCHSSWINVFKYFNARLFNIFKITSPMPSINKQGYAVIHINKNYLVTNLKKFCINNELPFLERKWNKIDASRPIGRKWDKI